MLMRWSVNLATIAILVSVDQATKILMIDLLLDRPQGISLTPFFNLVLGFNTGISFGLLNDIGTAGPLILSAFSMFIVVCLIVWLAKTYALLPRIALSMIIGGALGNIIDRVRHGAVTDFLDFYISTYHWPAFNIADTGIVVGAVMLIFVSDQTEPGRKSKASGD